MNTVKKINDKTAIEDFRKVMLFNLVNKIQYFYNGNYEAFWNAKDNFIRFRKLCQEYGKQTPQLTHAVYSNLEKFDRCGLNGDVVRAIFKGIPNYKTLISKFLVASHGTMSVKKANGTKSILQYGNIYRPETIDELRTIFEDKSLLKRCQNIAGNYYTKRQKRIIIKYVIVGTKAENEAVSNETVKEINDEISDVETISKDEIDSLLKDVI